MSLQFSIQTDTPVPCGKSAFDERNGFALIVFGMDVYEDCALLQELQTLLIIDLSPIRYPEGAILNEFVDLQLFHDFILAFAEKVKATPPDEHIGYEYISRTYLKTGLLQDLDFFASYCKCALQNGAKQLRWEIV